MRPKISPSRTATIITAALIAAPVAIAAPIDIGERNPAGGADAAAETQIIAKTGLGTYGTRQSNKGTGGGAIYGCRTSLDTRGVGNPDLSTPCIRVNNLTGGKAFDFVFDTGPIGGIIQAGNSITTPKPNAAPFVTNANAVALGLNADRVDGKHASELISEARATAGLNAEKVSGLTAAQIISSAQTGGGSCAADQVVAGDACIEKAPRAAATFADASAACGAAGRHLPTASELMFARTLEGIDLGTGEMASDLSVRQDLPLPDPLGSITSATVNATVADDGTLGTSPVATPIAYRCAQG
ncbi:hypothetical protein [Paraconexibacter sp.]|uniref:hypothetical protein n=1 Tax=Paraconexibacter sp. TaxID=2949640 RepID=UPI0035649589